MSQSERAAGILLHPTSLPGPWGSGDFGHQAEAFLDWAVEAGFTLWQILPISPPAGGCSPYTALSAFAVHPSFISVDRLVDHGLLTRDEVFPFRMDGGPLCDMEASERVRRPLLQKAWKRFQEDPGDLGTAFETFRREPVHAPWLEDWCLFAALRAELGNRGWWTWDEKLAGRDPEALDAARERYAETLDFERFLQFLAYHHWSLLRQAARDRGIRILGDLPIYVAYDSADLWAHPELFQLDAERKPVKVAGVPPDYFSEDGQLWGNPLYRWDLMKARGYRWWIDRLRINLHIADLVRLDHFRGFAGYWSVDADAENARGGSWETGPGRELFDVLSGEVNGPLPLVAEDLGEITDDVHALREHAGLPCMRVLQFGFDPPDNDHSPHRLSEDTLLYTGTHDNDTTLGWYRGSDEGVRNVVRSYTGGSDESVVSDMTRLAYASVARWAVLPMQDVLRFGSEARMNTPGVADGNWGWRMTALPGSETTGWLKWMAKITGRLPAVETSEEE